MGCFSWMFVDRPRKNVKMDGGSFTLLVPKAFGGKNITDSRYDGYGRIFDKDTNTIHDVYYLLAIWNREWVINNQKVSKELQDHPLSRWAFDKSPELYKEYFNPTSKTNWNDYNVERDSTCAIREIGIALYFNYKQRPYKLRFAENHNKLYEDYEADIESADDPEQGS